MAIIRKHAFILFITSILVIIFVIAIRLTISFADYPGHPDAEEKIRVEIVKSLLQLVIVIIIGGIVTALFKLAEQSREQSHLRAAVRTDYLKRLGSLYRAVKAARRTLRAGGLTSKYRNEPILTNNSQIELYKEQMERISEAQLELEGLKIESKYLPAFLSLKGVAENLEQMEKYLGKIVTEFEKEYPLLQNNQVVKYTDKFERLDEFTGEIERTLETENRFGIRFSTPYRNAIKVISESLT